MLRKFEGGGDFIFYKIDEKLFSYIWRYYYIKSSGI